MKNNPRYHLINIDDFGRKRWNELVTAHSDGRPYAYDWYLDIVSYGQWNILQDVKTKNVMPLPYVKKLGLIKQITRPIICQQLGPIIPEKEPTDQWISYLINNNKFINYAFNEACRTNHPECTLRTNMILDLKNPDLLNKFNKSLRKRLRKCDEILEIENAQSIEFIVDNYINNMASIITLKSSDKIILSKLLNELNRRGLLIIKSIAYNNKVIASGAFIKTHRRIINILGSSTVLGKKMDAMHYLLYKIMDNYTGQNLLFDFEGSDIKGVQEFFMQFGPEVRKYPYLIKKMV